MFFFGLKCCGPKWCNKSFSLNFRIFFFFKLCICDKLTEAKWAQGCVYFACRWPFAMQSLWYYQPLNIYKFSMFLRICLMWKSVEKRLFSNNFTVLDLIRFLSLTEILFWSLCLPHNRPACKNGLLIFLFFFVMEEIMALKNGFKQRK